MAFDWGILHWIQNTIVCPFLDAVVPKLTMLGNAGIIWILAGLALLCSKKYRRQGALVLMGLLAGLLVGNIVLKNLVARPRPCWLDPSVRLLIASPTDYSFPSGHTLSSTIAATTPASIIVEIAAMQDVHMNVIVAALRFGPLDDAFREGRQCLERL